jgi:hypothetical protein
MDVDVSTVSNRINAVMKQPTIIAHQIPGADVQKRSRFADRSAVAKRARQLKPGLDQGLALAGAVSLALFAWGLREISQAL